MGIPMYFQMRRVKYILLFEFNNMIMFIKAHRMYLWMERERERKNETERENLKI